MIPNAFFFLFSSIEGHMSVCALQSCPLQLSPTLTFTLYADAAGF